MSEKEQKELEQKVARIKELNIKLQATDYELAKFSEEFIDGDKFHQFCQKLAELKDKGASLNEVLELFYMTFMSIKIEQSIKDMVANRRDARKEIKALIEDVVTNYLNEYGEPYYTKDTLVGETKWK